MLVVVPATVLRNWVNEFHRWWPYFRVIILHGSGTGLSSASKKYESDDSFIDDSSQDESLKRPVKKRRIKDDFESSISDDSDHDRKGVKRKKKKAPKFASKTASKQVRDLVERVVKKGHVLITTYGQIRSQKIFAETKFSYCILDEGHKIRNPDSSVTLACKSIQTPHRIVLSGTGIAFSNDSDTKQLNRPLECL